MADLLSGLLYLTGLMAFALVVLWAVTADAPGIKGGLTGLLAMRDPREAPKKQESPNGIRWRRPRSGRPAKSK